MKRERLTQPKRVHVLPTESVEKFESEHHAFESAIGPRDRIEEMLAEDIAYHQWKVSERRRIGFAIIKTALSEALFDLLTRQLGALDTDNAHILVERWIKGDPTAKAEVHEMLQRNGYDETTIEAEAYIRCSRELAAVEQSEASHAARRDKTLPNLAFYREMMSRQVRDDVKRSLKDEELLRLENVRGEEQSRGH